MKRAFELKQKGFKVILTVSIKDPRAPETTQSVTDMFQFLMDSRRNEDGTGMKLKDAVDAWEVNQEVDIAGNWNPGGVDRADNLRQYVNLELIPAAAALHAGDDVKNWEKIISSSVSFRPDDLRAILTEAQAQNALHHIDYAGYHPYGRYIPSENINELKTRVDGAVAVAKEFGKPLAATEWNVRGYPTDGSRNEEWAQAIDYAYRNLIAPNFGIAVYYTLANDFAGRGGRTSARPAGLLKHDTTLVVTPQSSIDELLAWYRTPLVKSEPFYTTFETLVATQDNNTGN